jgi:serine/threonine protein kinase
VANDIDDEALDIAKRWCQGKGSGWSVQDQAGRGGTAPVFTLATPDGLRALKVYDTEFSTGKKGVVERKRIDQQVELGAHGFPHVVEVYEGGEFEERLFLLMNKAPGRELEKRLTDIPRGKIRSIVDQIARSVIFLRTKGICHRDIKSANVFISDDFNHATLLDLSVLRDIHDPIGIGTDDSGLPVVATARYSPPEYLFRLLESGPSSWHALDVYQLGGLLHDLIMRRCLFYFEYEQSRENRYRFAWTVATVTPNLDATDVDQDLVFTARRALDKNWERRSKLAIEDFLIDKEKQQSNALGALGLSVGSHVFADSGPTNAELRRRIAKVIAALEERCLEYLRRNGVTASHVVEPGEKGDLSMQVKLSWGGEGANAPTVLRNVEYIFHLEVLKTEDGLAFEPKAKLRAKVASALREADCELPRINDSAATNDKLGELMEGSLAALAQDLLKAA